MELTTCNLLPCSMSHFPHTVCVSDQKCLTNSDNKSSILT